MNDIKKQYTSVLLCKAIIHLSNLFRVAVTQGINRTVRVQSTASSLVFRRTGKVPDMELFENANEIQ